MSSVLQVVASKAILPSSDIPQPASLRVDLETGKIVSVSSSLDQAIDGAEVLRVDPSHILLPGLIE